MPATIQTGGIVWGVCEPRPLKGFPPGHIRLSLRANAFAVARVRDSRGIREFLIREIDGHWTPYFEGGRNLRHQ